MARPREFDEDQVLDQAMNTFWERGFDGTSIADLERATGLVRTSLYSAFGDKEALFGRALERFQQRYDGFGQALLNGEPARAGFEEAFRLWFGLNCKAEGPKGCLLQLASTTGAGDLTHTKKLIEFSAETTSQTVRKALKRAKRRGELKPPADINALANFMLVNIQGMSSAARTGSTCKDLEPVVALMLDTIFGDNAPE